MTTEQIVWTVVIVVVVLALVGLMVASMRKKSRQDNAARAGELRKEANSRADVIPDAQARARETEAQAEQARLTAQRAEERAAEARVDVSQQEAAHEDQIRAADRLDPDVNTKRKDYTPDTAVTESTRSAPAAGGATADHAGDSDTGPVSDTPASGVPAGNQYDADGRPIAGTDPDSTESGSHRA